MKKDKLFPQIYFEWPEDQRKAAVKIFSGLGDDVSLVSSEDEGMDYEILDDVLTMLDEAPKTERYTVGTWGGEYFVGMTGEFKGIPVVIFNIGHPMTTGVDELYINSADEQAFAQKIGHEFDFWSDEIHPELG